ncbi:T9SS type A sorting domain-containing protein [Ulvibacter litoralis]|uniref:Por secretion system C-terminal sorting domain-containing protein n=1 Tax=Ulvibacter litoralis TaxID=227084 RepID=A0A1G7DSR0_9FLAO|nr:T9SS type A sorting domain-containing protein [Ulvibacter litoralis]GHC42604.1 hypothetical protein GCM10008083_00910 [Ulvibacter litoralis]SDE53935.1 Por secretion system C-terminal sorting domain-containing protein [Ulvibacter litoralis]
MKRILTLLAILLSTYTYAQDPNILWQKTFGGSQMENFHDLKQTPDGGYILGGSSISDISGDKTENSNGHFDLWIIKIDSNGDIEWQNSIGGNGTDSLYSIELTPDGGYIISANSSSDISGDKTEDRKGPIDYWIVKLDSLGNVLWDKTIGGSGIEWFPQIRVTTDGYYVCGTSDSDISGDKTNNSWGSDDYWLLKLDFSGNILWQNTIGGDNSDSIEAMASTSDGGCILGGYSDSNISGNKTENSRGQFDYWAVKINSSGDIEWDKTIGGNQDDVLFSILQSSDGGYLLTGISISDISGEKTENSQGSSDYWVVKLDANGTIEWQNTIGGNDIDNSYAAQQTTDGGYLIGGFSRSNISGDKNENGHGNYDVWIVKLNNVGIIEWQNGIGGNEIDGILSIVQAADGSFVLGGNSSSNISGDKTEDSRGEQDFWILKHTQTLGLSENPFNTAITIYPNPTKNTLQINTQDQTIDQINIYSITGSRLLQWEVDTISPNVDVSSLATGVYYIQFYSGKNVALKKFVKE